MKINVLLSDEERATRDELASLDAEYEALKTADGERLSRYRTYREENDSSRDLAGVRARGDDYGQGRQASGTVERHDIRLPFGKVLTVKHSYRVSGRMPDVIVDRREETPQERYRSDAMEKLVWGILRASDGETQLADGAWDASELGAACFDLYFDVQAQQPKFRAIDPSGVLVVRGVDNPHNFQRVYRFWTAPLASVKAEYRDQTFRGEPVRVDDIQSDHEGLGGLDSVTIVQVGDRQRTLRFVAGSRVGLYERHHGLGFAPYVVIPNIGPYRDVWGWADYEFVRDLAAYLPRLISREADILRFVANGAMVDKGTGQSPEQVQNVLRRGGVLPSKKDGQLEPVQAPDVPAFEVEHAARIVSFVKMLGFAPDAAWGEGNAGSGSDRGLQLQPQLELATLKQKNWTAGLSRLFGMAFRMVELKQAGDARYRGTIAGVGRRRTGFNLTLTADPKGAQVRNPLFDEMADPGSDAAEEFIDVPTSPKELFDGDYDVRFLFQNRVDPDDPAYVMSELNKFQQGAQSLRTTLERLGVQSPEDEMRLIEQESDRFPWLRQGMIAMLKAQLAGGGGGQGAGGGNPTAAPSLMDSVDTMTSKDGSALNADAGAAGLRGGLGTLYGGA